MQQLFAWQFNQNPTKLITKIISKIKKIDNIIQTSAPKWPILQINKVDLAILRTATWELLYKKKIPTKVIIDEAIELAKQFSATKSSSFVNGVLATALDLSRPKETKNKHVKPKQTPKKIKN